MIRFYDYFSEDYKYTLYSLNYQKIENERTGSLALTADDSFSVEKKKDYLCCYYTRKLYFSPEDIFSMEAQFKILFPIKTDMDVSALTEQEILDSLRRDVLESLDQVAARMSLIISQTLYSANHEPVVLPPNVLIDEENTID